MFRVLKTTRVEPAVAAAIEAGGGECGRSSLRGSWAASAPVELVQVLSAEDDSEFGLEEWDAVRVPPGTWRGYEAGPAGLEMLVIGAPNLGKDPRDDVDGRRDWWAD